MFVNSRYCNVSRGHYCNVSGGHLMFLAATRLVTNELYELWSRKSCLEAECCGFCRLRCLSTGQKAGVVYYVTTCPDLPSLHSSLICLYLSSSPICPNLSSFLFICSLSLPKLSFSPQLPSCLTLLSAVAGKRRISCSSERRIRAK